MSDNGSETKKYKYLITMKWFVETDEELVAGATETDEKLLNLTDLHLRTYISEVHQISH